MGTAEVNLPDCGEEAIPTLPPSVGASSGIETSPSGSSGRDAPFILIIGHRGLLGRECLNVLGGRYRVGGADVDLCDITRPDRIERTLDIFQPGWAINCAALTDVDSCEKDPARAAEVNGLGPGHLARACRGRGVKLIQLSTDFIFDGQKNRPYREDDPPGPLNVYGRSKLRGEQEVAAAGGRSLIVRTSWLFGRGGKNFPDTILQKARAGGRLEVVADQRGSPTSASDLAAGIGELIDRDAAGVVHLTNRGDCTWYEYALFVLETAGIGAEVVPIGSEKLNRPAARPRYSVLSLERYRSIVGKTPRPWKEAVREYILGDGE